MRLSPLLKDDRYRDAILAEAALIIAEQEKLQATGADKIEGSKVCERLAAAVTPAKQAPSPKAKPSLTAASGKEIGQVLADTKAKGITININPKGGGASVDEILDALRPVIERDRKSTLCTPVTNAHHVCRLLHQEQHSITRQNTTNT